MSDLIFTPEIIKSMHNHLYWGLIACGFGLCFAYFWLNPAVMFGTILCIGWFFNPDEIIKGRV